MYLHNVSSQGIAKWNWSGLLDHVTLVWESVT